MEDREWLDDNMSLKQVNHDNPFTVPAGYFDDLEKRITSYINLDELKAGDKGFTVPENYFDELSANIESRIAVEELLSAEHAGFAVPENYFENLQQQINARITIEQALHKSKEDFTVPAAYFDNLNKNILNSTVNQGLVRRKGIVRKLFAPSTFKYAAAACFAIAISAGVFLNQPVDPETVHNNSFLHKQVQTISVNDIKSYLQQDVDAGDTQHAVIDENAPVNDASLIDALKSYNDSEDTNQ